MCSKVQCSVKSSQLLIMFMILNILVENASSHSTTQRLNYRKLTHQDLSIPFHHMRSLMSLNEESNINDCHKDKTILMECERCSKVTRSTHAFVDCCNSGQKQSYCNDLLKDDTETETETKMSFFMKPSNRNRHRSLRMGT